MSQSVWSNFIKLLLFNNLCFSDIVWTCKNILKSSKYLDQFASANKIFDKILTWSIVKKCGVHRGLDPNMSATIIDLTKMSSWNMTGEANLVSQLIKYSG